MKKEITKDQFKKGMNWKTAIVETILTMIEDHPLLVLILCCGYIVCIIKFIAIIFL